MPFAARVRPALTAFAACTCALGGALLFGAWRDACGAYALVLVGFPACGLGAIAALAVIVSAGTPARWRHPSAWFLFANVACFVLGWLLPLDHCS